MLCSHSTLRKSTVHLADLPQLPGHGVISGPGAYFLYSAAGEVAPAQRFDSLLQAAVQRGLSSGLRVQEQQLGDGLDENLLPQADVTRQLGADDTCRARGRSHTWVKVKGPAQVWSAVPVSRSTAITDTLRSSERTHVPTEPHTQPNVWFYAHFYNCRLKTHHSDVSIKDKEIKSGVSCYLGGRCSR